MKEKIKRQVDIRALAMLLVFALSQAVAAEHLAEHDQTHVSEQCVVCLNADRDDVLVGEGLTTVGIGCHVIPESRPVDEIDLVGFVLFRSRASPWVL